MQEVRNTLVEKMREYNIGYMDLVWESHRRKMNGGKGYGYATMRAVVLYGTRNNEDILNMAADLVRQKREAREATLAALGIEQPQGSGN